MWNLSGGTLHVTDATNASRTALFNIARNEWDDELLDFSNIPRAVLPEVRDSAAAYGETVPGLLGGASRIGGIAGGRPAERLGQHGFNHGRSKSPQVPHYIL